MEEVEISDRPRRENTGTGVEQTNTSFDKKTYEVKNSQLQLIVYKKKQEGHNDTHMYINTEIIVMFTQIN